MFNYVNFKCKCPKCGATVDGFQTKDGDLFLSTVDIGSITNFYSSCDKCETWIEFDLKPDVIKLDMFNATWRQNSKDKKEKKGYFNPVEIK